MICSLKSSSAVIPEALPERKQPLLERKQLSITLSLCQLSTFCVCLLPLQFESLQIHIVEAKVQSLYGSSACNNRTY
nr:hypothetical protein Iba_chr05eCG7380 [Ipomoea batatas]